MKSKILLISILAAMLAGCGITSNSGDEKETVKAEVKSEVEHNKEEVSNNTDEKVVEKEILSWNGQWEKEDGKGSQVLKISNENGETFQMTLNVEKDGSHQGLNGDANVSESKATYVDQWGFAGCELSMELTKDGINVIGSDECSQNEEIGKYFSGTYKKVVEKVAGNETLQAKKVLTPKEDSDIQKLLGEDYSLLVENTKVAIDVSDKYGSEDNVVIEGKTIDNKASTIFVIDAFQNYYVGNLIEGKIKVYTNDKDFEKTMHPIVESWSKELGNIEVEYLYKEL